MPVSVEAVFSAFLTNHEFPLDKNLIIRNLQLCLRLTGMEKLLKHYQCPKLDKVSWQHLGTLSIPFMLTTNQHHQPFMLKFLGLFFKRMNGIWKKKINKQTSSCAYSASLITHQINVVKGLKNF